MLDESKIEQVNMVPQPVNMKIKLFEHQLKSISKMEKLELNNIIEKETYIKETKIGINGDLTGYGKTLSMIGLIVRDKMSWELDIPYTVEIISSESKGRIKTISHIRLVRLPTTLILMSQNIIFQWQQELSKTDLKYMSVVSKKDLENIKVENYDVVLVTPSFYNKLITLYSNCAWKRFIFDEPGHLRISGMKELYAGFYWFITATPNVIHLQHRNCKGSFMKDLFGNIYDWDEFVKDITIQNDPEFVKKSFNMPKTYYFCYECYQPIYSAVHSFVTPYVKSMIEGGNIEGAISALGGEKTSNIVDLIKQKKLEELEEINAKIRIYISRGDDFHILEWNDRKKRVENQIHDIENKFQFVLNTSSCSICLNNFTSPIMEPGCQNIFCGECLLVWLQKNNTCPLCRIEIEPNNLIYIDDSFKNEEDLLKDESYKNKNLKKTRCEWIVEIIKKNKYGKFLVYSSFDNTFHPICSILYENNIEFIQLKGTYKNKEKKIDLFKNGKIPVIFLNSNESCAGINLTEATDIILCHEMTDSIKNQIIGRANRIGRENELHVHTLYSVV